MFCHKCGSKIAGGDQFCNNCGQAVVVEKKDIPIHTNNLDKKWWQRLLRVTYIFLYLQILWIVPVVWSSNSSSYSGYYGGQYHYEDTYGAAFWYSLLAIIVFVVTVRLIKLAVLYVAMAQKPHWRREFKKLF